MAAPRILIAGSADPDRTDYDPKLVDLEQVRKAAEEIGAALARRGCHIVVYSASPQVIEGDVVRGFVGALKRGAEKAIEVRYPYSAPSSAEFPEAKDRPELFVTMQDRNTSWEASFYTSLREADGVVIIGGGRSAQAIGYMALSYETPIAPVARFGGAAEAVWLAITPEIHLPTREECQTMRPVA